MDIRVNYGYTAKASFGSAAKVIEFNPKSLGTMDCADGDGATSMEELKNLSRRFLCGVVGRGKFVDESPDKSRGTFQKKAKADLQNCLENPITASLLWSNYAIPVREEYSNADLARLLDKIGRAHV